MIMKLIPRFLLITLTLSLGACFGSAPPVPKEKYFRLIAESPSEKAEKHIEGVIEIPPLQAEGVMGERPLLFTKNKGLKLEQRNYAYWTDPPAAMLRDQIVAYLRTAKIAKDVVPSELRIDAQYRLEGRIKRMEQLDEKENAAVMALDLALVDKATDSIVLSGTYEVKKVASGEYIDDAVQALNAGLNEILAKFIADFEARD